MKPWMAPPLLAALLLPGVASADEFWVDPVHGRPENDGSASSPWRSVQEVIDRGLIESRGWDSLPYEPGAKLVTKNRGAPVKGGDTIYLRSGYHGNLQIAGLYNTKDIVLAADRGHEPRFGSIHLRGGSHWVFRGLVVSPERDPSFERTPLIQLDSHNWHGPIHDVVVEGSRLRSIEDSSGWSAEDWNELSCDGLRMDGENMTIRNNVIKNVNFGIVTTADHSLFEGNVVENFAGDGIQGLGDYTTYRYNTIKNSYVVNDNHDDGFQSWSSGSAGIGTGEIVGVVLQGNTIINYEDPNQPHRGPLQGIGCFDGMYVDWVIENNVVIADHWHGITLLGARNSRIVNNTVLDPNEKLPGPAWISIGRHKNGTPSEGCVVRNNLATAISNEDKRTTKTDHNLIIKKPSALFVNPSGHDLHLKKGCKAIDRGSSEGAPDIDIEKTPRPWGNGFDLGAYEYHESVPELAASSEVAHEGASDGDEEVAAIGDSTEGDDDGIGHSTEGDGETGPAPATKRGEDPEDLQRAAGRGFGVTFVLALGLLLVLGLAGIGWYLRR